jgi:hypothetical protein
MPLSLKKDVDFALDSVYTEATPTLQESGANAKNGKENNKPLARRQTPRVLFFISPSTERKCATWTMD